MEPRFAVSFGTGFVAKICFYYRARMARKLATLTFHKLGSPLSGHRISAKENCYGFEDSLGSRFPYSTFTESNLLGNLKQQFHYFTRMHPPPKISPPRPFVVMKSSLDNNGPALSRTYYDEEIKLFATRLSNFSLNVESNIDDEDSFDQLFLMVRITKGTKGTALQFLCDLYADALGIQSISVKDRSDISDQGIVLPKGYDGPNFHDIDQALQLAFREYLEERGINEELFEFLQAWLYVKEYRQTVQWLKTVGSFIAKQRA